MGGKTICCSWKNLFKAVGPISAAYIHVQYVKIVSLSSGGVEVEE